VTESEYAQGLRALSVLENQSMMSMSDCGQGGVAQRVPKEYLAALSALRRKGMLTGSDLGNMIGVSQERGKFLLGYLERKQLARSEYHDAGRVRIFFYRPTNDEL
jgi:hypothetical protein